MLLSRFRLVGFRGRYTIDVPLSESVNYLIGRSGTGKTTLVKMLYASTTMRMNELSKTPFESIEIWFASKSAQGLKAAAHLTYSRPSQDDGQMSTGFFQVTLTRQGEVAITSDSSVFQRRRLAQFRQSLADDQAALSVIDADNELNELQLRQLEEVSNRVDAASKIREFVAEHLQIRWLPIERYTRAISPGIAEVKSVIDLKVEELQNQLVRYLSEIDKEAAEEFAKFRNNALLSLFKVEAAAQSSKTTTKGEIDRLAAELKTLIPELKLDAQSEQEFNESSKLLLDTLRSRQPGRPLEALRQAVARLHDIVTLWRVTQDHVSRLFERRDSFLSALKEAFALSDLDAGKREKFAKIPRLEANNELSFRQKFMNSEILLKLPDLSSGEKQFFILLAEALLEKSQETVLIIDEPELSLHITWQAALVADLTTLNPNAQLLLATHSPDIVQLGSRSVVQMEDVVSYS